MALSGQQREIVMADKKEPAAAAEGAGSMRVDTMLVRELAELLTANELTEIEVEDGDRKIRVRRELAPVLAAAPASAAPPETASPRSTPACHTAPGRRACG